MPVGSEQAIKELRECFGRAASAVAPECCDLTVAGRRVHASVAGPALAQALAGPVRQITAPATGAKADLELEIWSVAETGVEPPADEISDEDERHGEPGEDLRVASGSGRFFRYERSDVCQWIDRDRGRAVCWFRSAEAMNAYERGRPLHPLLLPWLEPQERWVLHAGLVARDGRGVLLPGRGGRGKTTATVACAVSGMDWAADDVAIVERSSHGRWTGHGVYSTAKLTPGQIERFEGLRAVAERPEPGVTTGAKLLVRLGEAPAFGGEAIASTRLVAIAIPTIDTGPSRVAPISGAEALREMIDGTVSVTAKPERATVFAALGELAAEVPAHRLFMGPDLDSLPRLIANL